MKHGRWTKHETWLLGSLAKQGFAAQAVSYRLNRSLSAVRAKTRREQLRLNHAVPLPKLDKGGALLSLGGLTIPSRPRWINGS
jgi:hypothetical protein